MTAAVRPCKFQGASNVQMIPNDMTNFEEGHMPPLTGCTGVQCLNITSLDNVAVVVTRHAAVGGFVWQQQVETDREPQNTTQHLPALALTQQA